MEKEIKASISINASPFKVWEALTRLEHDPRSDQKTGGTIKNLPGIFGMPGS